ncbi:MAG: hypothetical protein RR364_08085 [Lachnospiraceae bacterium]
MEIIRNRYLNKLIDRKENGLVSIGWADEQGIVTIEIFDFLLNNNILEQI